MVQVRLVVVLFLEPTHVEVHRPAQIFVEILFVVLREGLGLLVALPLQLNSHASWLFEG